MSLERDFQAKLIRDIKAFIPGVFILKNDAGYIQGIPDLTVFCGDKYAMLECKRSADAHRQPNQDYYLNMFGTMGAYSSYVWPDLEETVLRELTEYFDIEKEINNEVQ